MSARSWLILLGTGALLVLGSHAFDAGAVQRWGASFDGESDWYRLLRVMGYVPTWLLVGLVLVLFDRSGRERLEPPLCDLWTRGVLLWLSVLSAGAIAELLKLVIRRERPLGEPSYDFRPFLDQTFSTSGLGMPSSHTAVAFGGLVMLGLLHPPARWLFVLIAMGCAFTRVLAGAHFVSDVALGAVVGALCACGWWTLHLRNLRTYTGKVDA